MPPLYIGKSVKPKCFNKKLPNEEGFYYQNNKKGWMTSELFEEYVSHLEIKGFGKTQSLQMAQEI